MARINRQNRTRAKVRGVVGRPRLSVFRSNKFIYAQVIDDVKGHTLASAYGTNAEEVGEKVAKAAKAKKVKEVVFDRGGYQYHGNVKKLAEAARKGGLSF
jgi:large subunit ribosomal protein L18